MHTQHLRTFEPRNPDFEAHVRASFARQGLMTTLEATLMTVAPGHVVIEARFRQDLTQQHGFLHAAIVTALVDTACGYAALSLMPLDMDVLTVEYKVNFLAPARGKRFIAYGQVTKPGRTLTVCTGDVVAVMDTQEILVATMLSTMIRQPVDE
ncbi:MAG TPA: PaaI family thioesterase [Herpetosiphonaceae bacterium]|nr:PaaI family thioesterase [Herpetosiphonaceae bacterium]